MIVAGPLEEFDLGNQHRLEPAALGHLRLGESLAPPAASRFRQIGKGTVGNLQASELLEEGEARGRREAVPRARDVDQLLPS